MGRFRSRDESLFKMDLWDEAKDTEILQWAAEQGARPIGVDIALDTVRLARDVLAGHQGGCIAADVRALPFRREHLPRDLLDGDAKGAMDIGVITEGIDESQLAGLLRAWE